MFILFLVICYLTISLASVASLAFSKFLSFLLMFATVQTSGNLKKKKKNIFLHDAQVVIQSHFCFC